MVVQGVASAAATSVAIPAHQPGDLICVFVRRASNTWPTVPTAGGTVPSWLPTQFGGANTLSMGGWYALATTSSHTTGAWTNADQIIVLVLRPDSGKALSVNNAQASVTNGNNTQTILYPALVLQRTDGSSWVVRCGTRGVAVSTVATPPSGYTNQSVQPAGASALIAVHTRAGVTSNPTQDTVSTTGTNAAFRAISFEVLEAIPPQSTAVGGISSGQSFGAVSALAGAITLALTGISSAGSFGPVPQTVAVGGVYPTGYVPTITGQRVTGRSDAITGGYRTGVFGPVNATQQVNQTVLVGGVSSAQAFGSTTAKASIVQLVGGVGSAQTFGAITPKATIARAVSGVGSAQAFGLVLPQAGGKINVPGVSSAQAFGALSFVTSAVPVSIPGLASAQAFGAISFRIGVQVGVVFSAQAFGSVAVLYRAPVGGVASAQQFGVPTTRVTIAVGGVSSAQAFGLVRAVFVVQLPGLGSVQAFGLITLKTGPVTIPVLGLASEQAFGSTTVGLVVFNVWLDEIICTDVDLDAAPESDLALVASAESDLDLDPLVCQ